MYTDYDQHEAQADHHEGRESAMFYENAERLAWRYRDTSRLHSDSLSWYHEAAENLQKAGYSEDYAYAVVDYVVEDGSTIEEALERARKEWTS